MDWEVIKYDEKKLSITGLFFLLSIFFYGITWRIDSIIIKTTNFIISPYMYINTIWNNYAHSDVLTTTDIMVSFLALIFSFVYWYLLSCLIVYAWDKYRGKKK